MFLLERSNNNKIYKGGKIEKKMEQKTMNRLVGGLEALAGTVLIFQSEGYGLGDAGRYLGGLFVAEGTTDMITGEFLYLANSINSYFKKK